MDDVRVVVLVRGVPPARGLIGLHRALGLGLSEVRGRIHAGQPILDAELFGNRHEEVMRVVEAVLAHLADASYSIHECIGDDPPSPSNEITAEVLRRILAGHPAGVTSCAPGHCASRFG